MHIIPSPLSDTGICQYVWNSKHGKYYVWLSWLIVQEWFISLTCTGFYAIACMDLKFNHCQLISLWMVVIQWMEDGWLGLSSIHSPWEYWFYQLICTSEMHLFAWSTWAYVPWKSLISWSERVICFMCYTCICLRSGTGLRGIISLDIVSNILPLLWSLMQFCFNSFDEESSRFCTISEAELSNVYFSVKVLFWRYSVVWFGPVFNLISW